MLPRTSADGKTARSSWVSILSMARCAMNWPRRCCSPTCCAGPRPDVFRDVDVGTQSARRRIHAASRVRPRVQVLTDAGVNLPFNVRDKSVEFFAGESSRVRVIAGNSERVYSLTLPEMWDVKWTPPANARHGIPAWNDSLRRNRDWWPLLAALGALVLIAEWIAYGRYSPLRLRVVKPGWSRAA